MGVGLDRPYAGVRRRARRGGVWRSPTSAVCTNV